MALSTRERGAADQASRLRRMARQREGLTRTIAVISGKGGVGKSNIAVNLAVSLAMRARRTLLVDLDLGLANDDVLLNLQPRYTLAHVVRGARRIEDICIEGPGGIRFAPGSSGTEGLANLTDFERTHVIAQLRRLDRNTDIAIWDCGAGIAQGVLGFARSADEVLVVTTPQPTALTDAYAAIKSLLRLRYAGEVKLFVNMAESRRDAEAAYERVSQVARRFLNYSVADGGFILHDSAVERAVQARSPFVIREPGSNASACMRAVASSFTRNHVGVRSRGGLFQRVAGLFV